MPGDDRLQLWLWGDWSSHGLRQFWDPNNCTNAQADREGVLEQLPQEEVRAGNIHLACGTHHTALWTAQAVYVFGSEELGSCSKVHRLLPPAPPMPALGARVVHPQRGKGNIDRYDEEGRCVVTFDSNETHKYLPRSWEKILVVGEDDAVRRLRHGGSRS